MTRIADPDGIIAAAVCKYPDDSTYAPGKVVGGRLTRGAKKHNVERCGSPPIKGSTRCGKQGGKAPAVQRAADGAKVVDLVE